MFLLTSICGTINDTQTRDSIVLSNIVVRQLVAIKFNNDRTIDSSVTLFYTENIPQHATEVIVKRKTKVQIIMNPTN